MKILPYPPPDVMDSGAALEPSRPTCEHLDRDSIFYKGNFRANQKNRELFQWNEGLKLQHRHPCILCDNVYPIWATHCEARLIRPKKVGGFVFSHPNATQRRDYEEFTIREQGKGNPVWLRDGEYGEAYHVLMCCLYCHIKQVDIPMSINLPTGDFGDNIYDLFQWYGVPVKRKNKLDRDATMVSLKIPTREIAERFRPGSEGNSSAKKRVPPHPSTLFPQLRQYLDSQKLEMTNLIEDVGIMERYFYPSSSAKFWLNRYLRVTKQSRNLPRKDKVGRLAIIHVRLSAKTSVGRTMVDGTLKHVASSIAKANERLRAWNESSSPREKHHFTHIILYGDFDYQNGLRLKEMVEGEVNCKPEKVEGEVDHSIEVLFISGPWESTSNTSSDSNKDHSIDREVERLWMRFRDIQFDGMPVQVKILNVWTALCKRYSPRVCVIGHRSGFIEGAGFIGMPIFYLNNERKDLEKALKGKHQPGELLWGAVKDPQADRLRNLSDVMNTFIPVEALEARPRCEDATLEIAEGYGDELMSALFLFMCCNVPCANSRQVWPGWTARVDMMHDQCGKKWLRERYMFATGRTDECERVVWTGDAYEAWCQGAEETEDYERELLDKGLIAIDPWFITL